MISQNMIKDLDPILNVLNHPSSWQNDLSVIADHVSNPIVAIALTTLSVGVYFNPLATLGFICGFSWSPLSQNELYSRGENVGESIKQESQKYLAKAMEALPNNLIKRVSNLWNALPLNCRTAVKTAALISVTACHTIAFFYVPIHLYVCSGIAVGMSARRFLISESSDEKKNQLALARKIVDADFLKNWS